jgi:hypothetical protein
MKHSAGFPSPLRRREHGARSPVSEQALPGLGAISVEPSGAVR